MKTFITIVFFAAMAGTAFCQQTFSSKTEALIFLRESFSKNFVKEPVIIANNNKKFSYNYKINDDHLLLIIKTEGEKIEKWVTVPYSNMSDYYTLAENDYFKKVTGIGFKAAFGDYYGISYGKPFDKLESGTAYSTKAVFPFQFKKNEQETGSVKNAVNTIARQNNTDVKAAQKIADDIKLKTKADAQKGLDDLTNQTNKKISAVRLAPYKLFTAENIEVNLFTYLQEARLYKTKPSLIITWGSWCNICLRKIDTLLNNGLALKYNIILINKQPTEGSLTALLKTVKNHIPDYTKNALLLFDKNNQLKELDQDGTPFFLWLDKNLVGTSAFVGYNISIQNITDKLEEIQ